MPSKADRRPSTSAPSLFLPSKISRWAFQGIALGLMVDLDIGTESIRWLGDTRFVLGFLKGVVNNRNCRVRLKLLVEESDKVSMAQKAREQVSSKSNLSTTTATPHKGQAMTDAEGYDNNKSMVAKPDALVPDEAWLTIDSTSQPRAGTSSKEGHGMLYM